MRLSHSNFVPLLSIVAGGVLGASLSIGLLGRSSAVDVPAPGWQPDTEPPVFVMPAIEQSVQGDQIVIITLDGQMVIYRDGETGQNYVVRFTDEEQAAFERIEVFGRQLSYVRERIDELGRGDVVISNFAELLRDDVSN